MRLDTIWEGAQHICNVEAPKNGSKNVTHVRVRWLAMYVARRKGYTHHEIARFFGMHHTNVMHGALSFEQLDMLRELRALEEYLDNPPVPVQPATETELRDRLARIEQKMDGKIVREKLPNDRAGITLHFVIHAVEETPNGHVVVETDGYLQSGQYADGRLGELFLKCGKQGDHHAVLDSWAISTSIAIQYGAPVDELLNRFVGARFEPSGAVTGVEGIKRCTSPLDLVCSFLLQKYGNTTVEVKT